MFLERVFFTGFVLSDFKPDLSKSAVQPAVKSSRLKSVSKYEFISLLPSNAGVNIPIIELKRETD